jgi:hypothetical protein
MIRYWLKIIILTIIILISYIFIINATSFAEDGASALKSEFTLDPNQRGTSVQPGSEIHQLANGVTEVYGPDKLLKMRVTDSSFKIIYTPNGKSVTANHVYLLPSDCIIVKNENSFNVFQNKNNILKVVNHDSTKDSDPPPSWGGYVEQAND